MGTYAGAVAQKLKDLAPYAALELVMPGGSLMALLLWFYRRRHARLAQQSGGLARKLLDARPVARGEQVRRRKPGSSDADYVRQPEIVGRRSARDAAGRAE